MFKQRSRTTYLLFGLIIVGIALRWLAISYRPADALVHAPDEGEYYGIALNLAHGHGFALDGQPTAYRDFLFPAISSLLLRYSGGDPFPVFVLQIMLDVLTALLLFRLCEKRFGSKVGVLGAGIWLLYPAAILFSVMYLTETLFVCLWVAAIYLYDRLEEKVFAMTASIALGLCLGLLLLTRAAGLALLLAILMYLVLIRYETPFRVRLKSAGFVLATCLVILLPWMIRNWIVMDRFALNTNTGINLYIGNNPYATGSYRFDEIVTDPLEHHGLSEAQQDRRAAELARSYFIDYTRDAVNLWSRKFAYLWSTDMSLWAHYSPAASDESLSGYLRSLPVWKLAIAAVPYMLILLCGVAGIYLTSKFPTRGLFILQIFLGVMMIFLSYGLPRYRFPFMPALIICGLSLIRPQPWVSAPHWRRLFLLITAGMFGGIWLYEIMTIAGV